MTPLVLVTAVGPVEVVDLGRVGSDRTVLVVHGTPGDWRQAAALGRHLAQTHRVLLVSRPGYGRTPLSSGRSPRHQAAAYVAVLDALDLDSAAVIGISGGGPSARAFAAHHRDRCTGLVLCCAVAEHLVTVPRAMRLLAGVPGLWELGARVAARRAAGRLKDDGVARQEVLAGLGAAERVAVESDPDAAQDLLAFAHDRVGAMTSVAGLRNDFRWFRRATMPTTWPSGPMVPCLILHGDADDVVALAHGEYHRDAIPGARLEVLPGAGHAFVLSLRGQVWPRLSSFFEDP